MKPPSPKTDRVFGIILAVCIAGILGSGIAWALGWEYGPIGMVVAGAFANLPMFHFAMHWPFRRKRNPSKSTDSKPGLTEEE
ncbi:MAG: hypothetical protein HRU46_13945 [Verrucomicrobiales bacterium]|nr:hypothetical protein [Verrucomicrobiales bacterium]